MLGSSRRTAMLGLAMMAALGSVSGLAQAAPISMPSKSTNPLRYGYKGAGISMASQKRAAKKARNVRRNRAAHR